MKSEPIPLDQLWDIPCVHCGANSQCQWVVCANGPDFIPMCIDCDIALNHLILSFLKFENCEDLMKQYKESLVARGLMDG